jgi:hypothetical protein
MTMRGFGPNVVALSSERISRDTPTHVYIYIETHM